MDDRYWDQGEAERAPEEEASPRMFSKASEADDLNRALLPAALSATSYAKACWAFDVAAGAADPAAWMDEASFERDKSGLARAGFIAKLCSPLSARELGVSAAASGATFERGVWRKGDLGAALCCVATGVDGARELHLSVRGTEQQNNPGRWLSAFQTVVGYFVWTYPRIEKHAKIFEPLAEAIQRYAANPANGIERVVVSGHSLGAAAAETLLPKLRAPGVELEMFGFGSPGTGSGWAAPLLAAGRGAKAAGWMAARGAGSAASGVFAWAGRLAEGGGERLSGFSAMMRRAAQALRPGVREELAADRPRVIQFRHPNDPVPKMGSLIYSTAGEVREALWPSEFDRRWAGGGLEVSGFDAHAMTRYASAMEHMLMRAHEETRPHQPLPQRLEEMTRSRVEAAKLEALTPAAEHNARVLAARERNLAELGKNPKDPAIAWAKALEAPMELAERIKIRRAVRKFHAALCAQDRLGEPMEHGPNSLTRRRGPQPG